MCNKIRRNNFVIIITIIICNNYYNDYKIISSNFVCNYNFVIIQTLNKLSVKWVIRC